MEDIFKLLEDAGLSETVAQIKKDIKTSKMKKPQIEKLASELLKWTKKSSNEVGGKEPFSYPKKEVNRQKTIPNKPANEKVLQKLFNKMILKNNLDEVQTPFINEEKLFKLKWFKRHLTNKENIFPDSDKIYYIPADKEGADSNLGDSRSFFKPSSLDDHSDASVKFEEYKNYAYDKNKKKIQEDVSLPISGDMSSIKNQSVVDSFAHKKKPSSDHSKVNESFKNKMDDTDMGVSQIHKIDHSFIGNTSKSLVKEIEEKEEEIDEYFDDEDIGFVIHEAGESNFLEKCKEIAETYNYPAVAVKPPDETDLIFEQQRLK